MRLRSRLLAAILAAGGLGLLASPAVAAPVTISDWNSSLMVDAANGGAVNWTLNGVDYLDRQWFWYRTGNMLSEKILDATSLVLKSVTQTNTRPQDAAKDTLSLLYQDSATSPTFTVTVTLSLQGDPTGANKSSMIETIKITNKTSAQLSFSLYQFMDLDLAPTNSFETAMFTNNNTVVQYGNGSAVMFEQSAIATPTYRELSNSGTGGALLAKLTNTGSDNLSGTAMSGVTTLSASDVSWGNQWNFNIAGGSTVTVLENLKLSPNAYVPLPSAAWAGSMMLAGIAVMSGRRSRRK